MNSSLFGSGSTALLCLAAQAIAVSAQTAPPRPPGMSQPPPATSQPATAESQPALSDRPVEEMSPDEVARFARQLVLENRVNEALPLLERCLKESPNDRIALATLSLILQRDPTNVGAGLVAAENAIDRRDVDFARKQFKQILTLEPSNFRANLGMGRIYVSSKIWRQSTPYLEAAQRVAPPERMYEVLRELASAYLGEGHQADALKAAEEAIRINPQDIDTLNVLVEIYNRMGNYDKALAQARRLSDMARQKRATQPGSRAALEQLVQVLNSQLEVMRTYHITMYQRDTHNQPTDQLLAGKERDAAATLLEMAHLLDELRYMQAELSVHTMMLPLLERAFVIFPDPVIGWDFARGLRSTNQTAIEIKVLRKVLELDPNHREARERLEELGVPLTDPNAPAEPGAKAPPAPSENR